MVDTVSTLAMDKQVVQFILDNYLTLTIAFTILKALAKVTPWAWDDSLISLLFGLFKQFNPKTKSNGEAPK